MKYMLGIPLIFGSLCGLLISLLGNVITSSPLFIINGIDLSLGIGIFSIIALISGLYTIFVTD